MMYSVEVGPEAKKGEGRARRSTLSPDELVTHPEPGVETLYDVVLRSGRLYPNQRAMGWRDLIKESDEEKEVTKIVDGKETKVKKTWKYFEMTDYKFWTYKELCDKVELAGAGLSYLGLSKSTTFNIYATTSYKWQLMAMACMSRAITFCTSYDSLGEDGLKHSLNEPEVVGIFTNGDLLPTVIGALPDTPTVKVVVYAGDIPAKAGDVQAKAASIRSDIKVLSLDELLQLGKEHPAEENRVKPTREDVACIMYTSGSTGKPKGVVLTHSNLVCSIAGVLLLLADYIKPGESYIAYLPLAHIMEFIVELCMFFVGAPIGYGTVKTLTDASMRNCYGDMRAFKPTIMVGVPAVWELIRKGIATKVKAGGSIKSKLFSAAVHMKQASPSLLGPLTDVVVFNQVKLATGGKLKYGLSGGAPISPDTQLFLQTCLTNLIQGYGMTESCGMCAVLPPGYPRLRTVGMPVPSIEIKFKDVEDAGYFANHDPPQGEILIRGGSVTSGYYKRDDLNKESYTEDGWLLTGDIGQWNPDGTLSIIDRKKNLIKLSGGEYIALERLESIYKSCPIVANIMVYAQSDAKQPMAVVFPHEHNLRHLVSGSDGSDLEHLCSQQQVRDAALKELNATGKKAGFKSLELLQTVILTSEEWTAQNGFVTAAQKLNRKVIYDHFKDQIQKVYPGSQ